MASVNKFNLEEENKQSSTTKRRRRWSALKKLQIVEETKCSSASICSVAQKNEINPNLLSHWRRLEREGKLKVINEGVEVVPAPAISRLQIRILALEQLLEKKSKEIEVMRATISRKPIVNDLERYPFLRMAIKYNLFSDTLD